MSAAKALRSPRRSGASIGSGSAAMCRLQRPQGSALRRAHRHLAHFQAKIASDRIKAPSSCSARVKPLRTVQLAVRRCVFQPHREVITGSAPYGLSVASRYTSSCAENTPGTTHRHPAKPSMCCTRWSSASSKAPHEPLQSAP